MTAISFYSNPLCDLDAEESVLGAMMLAPFAIRAVTEISGLTGADFYREGHGHIFRAILALDAKGEPVDAITVVDELGRAGTLEAAGGSGRVHELAALVPAASNAAHYARIVGRKGSASRLREVFAEQATALNEGREVDLAKVWSVLDQTTPVGFAGTSHLEVLAAELPQREFLVSGLIPAGEVVQMVGLPEVGKSYLAAQMGLAVGSGRDFLGWEVEQGPVGAWLQDGSRGASLRRIRRLSAGYEDLPIRWHLAENLQLPRDLPVLRREVEQEEQRLVILDSLYNFLDGVLRDEDAAVTLAAVKSEVVDRTGATVLVVDHSPWPSEQNKGQRRAYGTVFKQAVHRATIHLDRKDDQVTVNVAGNDVEPVCLKLQFSEGRLVPAIEGGEQTKLARFDRVARAMEAYLREHGPETSTHIAKAEGVKMRREAAEEILEQLVAEGRLEKPAAPPPGRTKGNYFAIAGATCPGPEDKLGQARAGDSSRSLSRPPSPPVGGRVPDTLADGACPDHERSLGGVCREGAAP
jgi:hypothetical protein